MHPHISAELETGGGVLTDLPPSRPIPVEVVKHPEFQQSHSQTHFSAESIMLMAGVVFVIPPNPYRKTMDIRVDSGNAADVWIAARGAFLQASAPFPKGVKLPATLIIPYTMTHTAEIALVSASNATVYVTEERYAAPQ